MKIYCAKIEGSDSLSNNLFGMLCIAESEEDKKKIELLNNITLSKGADISVDPEKGTIYFTPIKE